MMAIAGGILLALLVLWLIANILGGLGRRTRPYESPYPGNCTPEQEAAYADPNHPIRVLARKHKAMIEERRLAGSRRATGNSGPGRP